MSNLRVGVIGAGIIGLSTATEFQNEFPSTSITLLSENFLTDTTSDGAAGLYRPTLSFPAPTMELSMKWLEDSLEVFTNFLRENPTNAEKAGVKKIDGYILSSDGANCLKNPLLKKLLPVFRQCSKEELLEFPNAKHGIFCSTVLAECRRYLPYLTEKFTSSGGVIVRRKIESFSELGNEFDLVFNCSGLGARQLCNDLKIVALRGQIIKVEAPWVDHFLYIDNDTYVIPGFDTVTLGGTRQYEHAKMAVDKHDREGILDRCTTVIPSLKNAKIVRDWVGLRPHRSSIRIESEIINIYGSSHLKVVHNYGHGGYGVQSAPGTAKQAVEVAFDVLRLNVKPKL